MKVVITETTVVSYEIDVPQATAAVEAARVARAAFNQALDNTRFRHSVAQNSAEYTVIGQGTARTFVSDQLDS